MNGSTDPEPIGGTENVKDNNNGNTQEQKASQKNDVPKKSEEITEFLVCNGAKCTCDKAVDPGPKKLNVLSHNKYIINDNSEIKLLATTLDNKLIGLNFGQCKVPDPSKPVPCTAKLQWKDYYERVELPNGAYVLTDKSTATCTSKGGSIKIIHHGQQANITAQELENAKAGGWAADSPLITEEVIYTEQEAKTEDEDGASVKSIQPLEYAGQQPLNTPVTFKATFNGKPTEAAKQGVNWIVYDANGVPVQLRSDAGETFTVTFRKPGTYMIEAYGKTNGDKKVTKTYTIKENEIDTVSTADGKLKVRIKEPVEFRLTSLFKSVPLSGDINTVTWTVTKVAGTGNPSLLMPAGRLTQVVCDEECSYVVAAYFNGISKQSKTMQAVRNGIISVSTSTESSRVNETVTFSVKDQFKISPPRPAEIATVKWTCKDAAGNTIEEFKSKGGETVVHKFNKPGEYTVQPYMVQPSAKVAVKVVVAQPEMISAQWEYPEGGKKGKTGWNEPSRAVITFKAAEGITVNLEYGYIDKEGKPKATQVLTKLKIPASQIINIPGYDFSPDREKYKSLLKEGGEFYFKVNLPDKTYTILNTEKLLPRLKLVTKEEIVSIEFFNGKKPVIQAVYGTQIRCFIRTRNLSAKQVNVKICRRESFRGVDILKGDTAFHDKKHDLSATGTIDFNFTLDKSWEKNGSEKIPYFYAVIEEMETFGISNTLVAFKGAEAVDGGKEKEVGVADKDAHANGNCPRCKEPITKEILKKIYKNANDSLLGQLEEALTKYRGKFMLNTCSRKAHFFAQSLQEVGFTARGATHGEDLNYTVQSLANTFSAFRKPRKSSNDPKVPNELAEKYGGKKNSADSWSKRPDEKEIGNIAYQGPRVAGNGDAASGDGWKYRGRGLLQITGKTRYQLVQKAITGQAADSGVDIMKAGDRDYTGQEAALTGMADWFIDGMFLIADNASKKSDDDVVLGIINKINSGTDEVSKEHRKIFYRGGESKFKKNPLKVSKEGCMKGIFKVDLCNPTKKTVDYGEKGTIVVVSGTKGKMMPDPAIAKLNWAMYQTDVYRNMSLQTYEKLKKSNKLPGADYTTYLSRDTQQTYSKRLGGDLTHADTRFGKYNEIPPGTYYLIPKVAGQSYEMYIGDSEASTEVNGVDGSRDGVAIHHYCPRFSVGCFTMNSGKDTNPVKELKDNIPDLKLGDNRPVRLILEERKVKESQWGSKKEGTKKWTGYF